MIHYFAYGSNMDETQMCQRCSAGATIIGKTKLPNHRFIINSRGVATVTPQPKSEVHGIVWEITNACEKSLDDCEGVKYGTYTKEMMPVEIANKSTSALVYIAKDNTHGSARSGYMEMIIAAAEKHRFPDKYIEELKTWLKKKS